MTHDVKQIRQKMGDYLETLLVMPEMKIQAKQEEVQKVEEPGNVKQKRVMTDEQKQKLAKGLEAYRAKQKEIKQMHRDGNTNEAAQELVKNGKTIPKYMVSNITDEKLKLLAQTHQEAKIQKREAKKQK